MWQSALVVAALLTVPRPLPPPHTFPATSADLVNLGSDRIVGTVVGVGAVQEYSSPNTPYAVADVLVNEVIATKDAALKPGRIVEVWISFSNLPFNKTTAPQNAFVDYGRIGFSFKGPHLTEQEVRDAALGNRYFFNLTPASGFNPPHWFVHTWPLQQSAWVRACWTAKCPGRAP